MHHRIEISFLMKPWQIIEHGHLNNQYCFIQLFSGLLDSNRYAGILWCTGYCCRNSFCQFGGHMLLCVDMISYKEGEGSPSLSWEVRAEARLAVVYISPGQNGRTWQLIHGRFYLVLCLWVCVSHWIPVIQTFVNSHITWLTMWDTNSWPWD